MVENQPGASGAIGTRAVMKRCAGRLYAADGLDRRADGGVGGRRHDGPFDVNKYLTPIVIGAAPPYLLVASPTLPVKTTAELIRYAREKPDGLTFGSSGVGAASHLSGLLFASDTGIKMLHVPYKGTGPAVTDLLGGRIDSCSRRDRWWQQFVQSGQLKALGVTDTQRSKFYPDVPTVADTVPGYESVGWFGLLAPPNTPPEIVNKLNEVIVAAMQTQEFRDHLATLGAEPRPQTPRGVRSLYQRRRCQVEQARERQRRAIAGRKVRMRLATFIDPQQGHDARFGIVSGDSIIDVVAAANALAARGRPRRR